MVCSEEGMPIEVEEPEPTSIFNVPNIIPTGDEQYLNLKSDYIFDQNTLHTYHLLLPQAALDEINSDPAAEQYVEGVLIFEGDTISPVGIRYKGSIGAFVGCVSGTDFANPSGKKTCTKLSMKIKINWEGRKDKFYKLKKLQFHSQNLNRSQMHERLGYWLFRQMGVPAPRSVHAKLMINGEYNGLFALTEQIDGRFSRFNFDDGKGNIYKEVWPLGENGKAQDDATYLAGLKTNEDDNPSLEIIKSFAQEIEVADATALKSVIEKWMDLDEIIAYSMVDRMIRHDDGPFHWYCNNGCSSHNFYWYEEPKNRKIHLIPWDLDNAFENIQVNTNPVTPIADDWGEITNDCMPFKYGTWNLLQRSAACDKLTAGWALFTDEYDQKKSEFLNGPFSRVSVESMLDQWSAQIRDATIEAHTTHTDAISLSDWERELDVLKSRLGTGRSK